MPYHSVEEKFILQYRQQLEAQSSKQTVPQLEKDDRGVDFSRAEGECQQCTHPPDFDMTFVSAFYFFI